ncbi:MAG TPA: spirocyclase AveC family protein [Acidimicrobiia bacterium]|nr:spirocyclase AveC family protein [Acidimicrobiia bacterium]
MLDTERAARRATVQPPPAETPGRRPFRPVVWWAAVGAAFVIFQIWLYATWFLSGDAYRQPMGADPVSGASKVTAWLLQGGSTGALVVVVVYLVRRSRREGALTWDAYIAIGFLSVFWQDTLCNYLRPTFIYNSYLVNLGAWYPHVPGWVAPHFRNIPEPFLLTGPLYGWYFVLFAVAFCAMARRAERRWPRIGRAGLFAIGVGALFILDMVIEMVFLRAGLFAYSGAIRSLSVWGGRTYQYPLYEGLFAGSVTALVGLLRYHRDDRGRSAIERGVDTIGPGRRVTAVRALAWVGLANVCLLWVNVSYAWISLYVDPTPRYPSYMTNGLCGEHSDIACPAPGVPVPTPR